MGIPIPCDVENCPAPICPTICWWYEKLKDNAALRARVEELEERNRVLEGLLDELEDDPDVPMHHRATIDQVRTIQKDGRVVSSELRISQLEQENARLRESNDFYYNCNQNQYELIGRMAKMNARLREGRKGEVFTL